MPTSLPVTLAMIAVIALPSSSLLRGASLVAAPVEVAHGGTAPVEKAHGGAAPVAAAADPAGPDFTEIARRLVSSAENSSLDWRAQYAFIAYNVEGNRADNRGYTGGIVGFTSRTHDMLVLVRRYTAASPGNPLAGYLPALAAVDGTPSATGLGTGFESAWRAAAADPVFQRAQRDLADEMYYRPALDLAARDGLRALGRFAYIDAMVMHGPGDAPADFGGIRAAALAAARPPSGGGDESTYLNRFLDARVAAMRSEAAHQDVSRVETAQRRFLREGNLDLRPPLRWSVYGDDYRID